MTASRRPRVVAIDALAAARGLHRELAAHAGFRLTALDCREASRETLLAARPDVVVLDWSIGSDPAGLALLHALSIDIGLQRVPVVICTEGVGGTRATSDERVHFLPKPFTLDELLGAITRALGDAHRRDAGEG